MKRHLAAILVADVVGYTHHMEADEVGTLDRLGRLLDQELVPRIEEHGGRVFKFVGNGLLAEFPSVVEAVKCAVTIQRENLERNVSQPEERQLRLRIGVNLGDIIVEGDDVFGEGVNLASRLEQKAETNGVCITAHVYEQVARKIDVDFVDIGEHLLKNISKPVRVYSYRPDQAIKPNPSRKTRGRRLGLLAICVVIGIIASLAVWKDGLVPPQGIAVDMEEPAEQTNIQRKPTIAVLPLSNIS